MHRRAHLSCFPLKEILLSKYITGTSSALKDREGGGDPNINMVSFSHGGLTHTGGGYSDPSSPCFHNVTACFGLLL